MVLTIFPVKLLNFFFYPRIVLESKLGANILKGAVELLHHYAIVTLIIKLFDKTKEVLLPLSSSIHEMSHALNWHQISIFSTINSNIPVST